MSFHFSEISKQRLASVDPRLQDVAHLALELSPIDFGIPAYGGKRTPEEQAELFKAGKSKCDGVKKRSAHQSGNALDFYAYVEGHASWEIEHLAIVACAFLQAALLLGIKVKTGGLWKSFVDWPHIELTNE